MRFTTKQLRRFSRRKRGRGRGRGRGQSRILPRQTLTQRIQAVQDERSSEQNRDFYFGQTLKFDFKWTKESTFQDSETLVDQNARILNFDASGNPTSNLSTIFDFFFCIFNQALLSLILCYTNIRLKKEKPLEPPISLNELKTFLGLLILFGANKKGHVSLANIWSPDSMHYQ